MSIKLNIIVNRIQPNFNFYLSTLKYDIQRLVLNNCLKLEFNIVELIENITLITSSLNTSSWINITSSGDQIKD